MYHVTAIGELLIDFIPCGTDETGTVMFARYPGGAPANVLAMNARLGGRTAFIGKVGQDDFGHYLKKTLEVNGIETVGLVMTSDVNTTLAFVHLDERGDRSFSFYRHPGADMMLYEDEVNMLLISRCEIFHFGSVSLTDEPVRSATLSAVDFAKKNGKIVSFDPNYRPFLWESQDLAQKEMSNALSLADIIKVSEEEMSYLTGETDLCRGAERLARFGAVLVLITLGRKGAYYYTQNCRGFIPTYHVKAIDTTGAGDAFLGAIHYRLQGKTTKQVAEVNRDEIEDIVSFANAAGSLTTTRKGAISAMPTLQEIEACQKNSSKEI
jgi:fructokinase